MCRLSHKKREEIFIIKSEKYFQEGKTMCDTLTAYTTKRMEKENFLIELPERISYAYSTMNFNQNLIQFAESKSHTLLLINSIFLATATTLMETPQEQTVTGTIFKVIRILFLIASAVSVIKCLLVVAPTKGIPQRNRRKDFIFFKDILSHNTADMYRYEFCKTQTPLLLEDILKRCYTLAHIASAKFSLYEKAQGLTFISCILWLTSIFLYYL